MWYAQVPDASYVHAHGIITNPLSEIETLRELHGVKKSTHFCIWVDRVRIEKLSDTLYLARFDKWEKSGEVSMRQDCCDSWFHGEIYSDPSTILVVQELLVPPTMSKIPCNKCVHAVPSWQPFRLDREQMNLLSDTFGKHSDFQRGLLCHTKVVFCC